MDWVKGYKDGTFKPKNSVHISGHILFYFLHAAQTAAIREKSTPGRRLGPAAAIRPAAAFSIDPKTPYSSAAALSRRREIT